MPLAPADLPEHITGRVELRDIHFCYPARPDVEVMSGFNLVVEPGQTLALVGESGSGKSTTIQLIQRFYDPVKGQVSRHMHMPCPQLQCNKCGIAFYLRQSWRFWLCSLRAVCQTVRASK